MSECLDHEVNYYPTETILAFNLGLGNFCFFYYLFVALG